MNDNDLMTRRLGSSPQGVCALVQDMLPFYLEDDVSGQSRAFIHEHLETCDRCASFLAGGRSVQEHLRRDSALRSDSVARDVRAQDVVTRGRRQLMGYSLIGAGIAAFIVIGVLFGFNVRGLRMSAAGSVAAPEVEAVHEPYGFSGIATATPVPALRAFGGDVSAPVPDVMQPTVVPPWPVPDAPPTPPAMP